MRKVFGQLLCIGGGLCRQAAGGVIAITTDEGIFNGEKIRQKVKFGSNNSIYSGTYYSKGKENIKISLGANLISSSARQPVSIRTFTKSSRSLKPNV